MIGIVTCQQYPHLTPDDQLLTKTLPISWRPVVWTQTKPENLRVRHLLLRSPWDYYLESDRFLEWLQNCEKNKIQVINSLQTILWNYKKNYLGDLKKFGCSVVDTLFFDREDAYETILPKVLSQNWTEIVIKPTISATSHLTFRTSINDPQLKSKIHAIQKFNPLMIQPYIPSVTTEGELSLVFFNNRLSKFSHAVSKTPKKEDFRVQEEFGGVFQRAQPSDYCMEVAERCLQIIPGDWCYARVDLLNWRSTRPLIGELELIEPSLYLEYSDDGPQNFITALQRILL